MNIRHSSSIITLCISVLALAGCVTSQPAVYKDVNNKTINFITPSLTLLPRRTPLTQSRHGMMVTVTPGKFGFVQGYLRTFTEQSAANESFLQGLASALAANSKEQDPSKSFLEKLTPIILLNPDRLSFRIRVTNNTKHTLKMNPLVQVAVDSEFVPIASTEATEEDTYLHDLLSYSGASTNAVMHANDFHMSIPPGSTQEAVMLGPDAKQIFQGNENGTIILYLNGISYDTFNPRKKVRFQWDFSYTVQQLTKSMPVKERMVFIPVSQAIRENKTIVKE